MRLFALLIMVAACSSTAPAQSQATFAGLAEVIARDSVALASFSDCYGNPLRVQVRDSTWLIPISGLNSLFVYLYDGISGQERFTEIEARARRLIASIEPDAHDPDRLDSLQAAHYSPIAGLAGSAPAHAGPALALTFTAPYGDWVGAELAETRAGHNQCERLLPRGVNYLFRIGPEGSVLETLSEDWISGPHFYLVPEP